MHIGNENLPSITLLYEDQIISLHQDFIEILMKCSLSEPNPIAAISISQFKNQLNNIISIMNNNPIEEVKDEYQYEKYIFHIAFQIETKDNVFINFEADTHLLAVSEKEARNELAELEKDNRLFPQIDKQSIVFKNKKYTINDFKKSTFKKLIIKKIINFSHSQN